MERLKQLIEKLKAEAESGAGVDQLMETIFEITRSIMVKKQLHEQPDELFSKTSREDPQRSSEVAPRIEAVDLGKVDLAEKLSQQPIESVRSAMGINEKYIFLQTFFKGEAHAFESMMSALEEAKDYEEAKSILGDHITVLPMSEEQVEVLEKFDYLLRRKFFSI